MQRVPRQVQLLDVFGRLHVVCKFRHHLFADRCFPDLQAFQEASLADGIDELLSDLGRHPAVRYAQLCEMVRELFYQDRPDPLHRLVGKFVVPVDYGLEILKLGERL